MDRFIELLWERGDELARLIGPPRPGQPMEMYIEDVEWHFSGDSPISPLDVYEYMLRGVKSISAGRRPYIGLAVEEGVEILRPLKMYASLLGMEALVMGRLDRGRAGVLMPRASEIPVYIVSERIIRGYDWEPVVRDGLILVDREHSLQLLVHFIRPYLHLGLGTPMPILTPIKRVVGLPRGSMLLNRLLEPVDSLGEAYYVALSDGREGFAEPLRFVAVPRYEA